MTCRDAAASLEDFVDGSLPLVRRQALAEHLRECGTCSRALKEVRCTLRLLRQLPRERMPDLMRNRLLDELRRSRSLVDPAHPPSPQPSRSAPDEPRYPHGDH